MNISIITKSKIELNLTKFNDENIVSFDFYGRNYRYSYDTKIKAFRKFIELRNLFNS